MSQDLLRYDLLVQEALRSVVRGVLEKISGEGMPGDHHLYVTFRTGHPGVAIPQRLRETYPEEMTIVLQHQFFGLERSEGRRVGKECVSEGRSRGSPYHKKKKK